MYQPMMTPPMPHRIVSQIGMLSLSPGATNLPSRPMMMPAMMTPMISMSRFSSDLGGSRRIATLGFYPVSTISTPAPGRLAARLTLARSVSSGVDSANAEYALL